MDPPKIFGFLKWSFRRADFQAEIEQTSPKYDQSQ